MKYIHRRKLLFILILACTTILSRGSDIIEVLPLTNKILMVHFDDGSVTYPNTLKVSRLAVTDADNVTKWLFSSNEDADFQTEQKPVKIGRKSKGTEFIKDPAWGGNSFDPRQKQWASEHWLYLVFDKEMKPGKSYTLKTGNLAANDSVWNFVFDEKNLRSEAVHVNTLGYISTSPKYGYVYQWMGSLGNLDLTNYLGKKFFIQNIGTGQIIKEGIIKKRKQANNPETAQIADTPDRNFLGAEVAECDFSDVTSEGSFRLIVEGVGSSYPFKIGKDAVWDAYYAVARALYHQRSGIRLAPPYTTGGYIRPVNQNTKVTSDDETSFAGKLLYSDYSFLNWDEGDGGGNSKEAIRAAAIGKTLDVAGWYHDAGDWDSYWTHQRVPMLLMLMWEFAPDRFADNELNIPESGNGIPDIVDEASWLIKFNYRLRKELKSKGYSDGGVGGARICADVFTDIDGNAESKLPSWKENRHTVVTKVDAFMTFMYAGEAAQFACILKSLGKNPEKFPVEMLDDVDFSKMSKDEVNWITEAEEAYAWASAPANQQSGNKNYSSKVEIYKMYAAVNLFRLTGKEEYHKAAKAELSKLQNVAAFAEDERWGAFSYLLSTEIKTDKNLQNVLKNVTVKMADNDGISSSNNRACRWGGNFSFPMLVGQATTPMVFESIIAACITGEKKYRDVVHTTADYFLGTNPLHSTWMTGVGPRPATCGFHLDSRYNNNWVTYPGFIPYGPWSMAYGYTPYTWVIDGVSMQGGHGPWNKDWANFSMYPLMEKWPGHERWNSNIHAPLSTENTIHQNTVYGALTYGFVNSRHYENSSAAVQVGSINLNRNNIIFNGKDKQEELIATLDIENATFPALKWTSSNTQVAHVDAFGKITAVNVGSCQVTCSTLDGSVSAVCTVTCNWTEIALTAIKFNPETLLLNKGQSKMLSITFLPDSATNKLVNFSVDNPEIAEVDASGMLTAIAEGVTVITATTVTGGLTAHCTVTVEAAITPVYKEEVFLDFESITLNWENGYGSYAWNSDKQLIAANPSVDNLNPSTKVFQWTRDISGNAPWGGYGIVLPVKNTGDWEHISFQVFATAPVFTIRIEVLLADAKQGEITLSNLNIPANQWTTVTFGLAEMGLINKSFDKIQVQIAGGSNVPLMTTFSDNFKFEKELPVSSVEFLKQDKTKVQLYPNPAKSHVNVICLAGIASIEVFSLSGMKIYADISNGENYYVLTKKELNSGLHFVRITDMQGCVYVNKLIIEEYN